MKTATWRWHYLRSLTILLTVILSGCSSDSDEDPVVEPTPPGNQFPIVLTSNIITLPGTLIELEGSATDSDGTIATYEWEQTSGVPVTLSSLDTPTTSFTTPAGSSDSVIVLSLTATDNEGASTSGASKITVLASNNNRVILGPLIGATISAALQSNPTGIIETRTTLDETNLATGGTFSLLLDGQSLDDWVMVTATGGTDIDADDDGVLDVVPTLNTGEIRALAKVSDWRTAGTNVNMLTEIAVRRVLNGETDISTVDTTSLQFRFASVVRELVTDVNSDTLLDHVDLLNFTPENPAALVTETFTAAELNAVAQALEAGNTTLTDSLIASAFSGTLQAVIHTSLGDITIELFEQQTPDTVANFATHARNGYYDGLTFHRVITDFIVQGGDPLGTGAGGASILGGTFSDEFDENLSNVAGTLSMANSGTDTNGSQFFFNVSDNTELDFNKDPSTSAHTVFGRVTSGMDIVTAISQVTTDASDKPEDDVTITGIDISRP